jgi:DNA-binding response OmpR family regulator
MTTQSVLDSNPLLLHKRKVLVVEDEVIISFLIQDLLQELGCADIWVAPNVKAALEVLADGTPDLALLDVNLAGEQCFPVAEALAKASVPFLFTTGYGRVGLPAVWDKTPVLQKPYDVTALEAVIREIMAERA